MLFAWDRRNTLCERLALIILASSWLMAGCPEVAGAQETSKQQAASPRTIILPQRVVAGQKATLAVIDGVGRLLPGVAVELSGGQMVTTDSTGRALFQAPTAPGTLIAKISGTGISASSTGVPEEDGTTQRSSEGGIPGLEVTLYPRVLTVHDRFAIVGNGFHGWADLNHIFLADRQCLVIAASPVSLEVLPGPHIPVGPTTLRVSVDGHDVRPIPVTAVLLDFSGPADVPTAGADGKLILRIHGTTEPLAVEVRNGSPRIIQLLRGNLQRLGTSGGEQNIAPVQLKFLASGDYTITARLVPADSGNPQRRD